MLRKDDKHIQYARDKIQQYLKPNVIHYIELEKRTAKLRLQRLMLHELPDTSYVVSRTTYNCRLEVNSVEYDPAFFITKHKHLALEKINMVVTELEQEGFDVTDEFEAPLCVIARKGWSFHSPTFQCNLQFYGENHQNPDAFLFQKIPAGLQVVVMVDDQGKISINDLEDTMNIIVSNVKVNGNARGFLENLSQQDGFRSLILEAVYDGQNVYVTDGSYIHDMDLRNFPFEKRLEILSKYMGNTKNNTVCGLIEAETLEPEQWGHTSRHGFVKALIARRKDALCSLYRLLGDSTSATIIGESEPVYFDCVQIKGNTATLRNPINKKTTPIYYPFLDNRMLLKPISVIGPISISEPAFIF